MTRNEARWKIIQAANRHKLRTRPTIWMRGQFSGQKVPLVYQPKLLGMRQIEWAVCIVRRNKLISGDVLEVAGYNATA